MRIWQAMGLIVAGSAALAIVAGEILRTSSLSEDVLPGLDMAAIDPGDYNLTILVPNSLGRKYYSKPARIGAAFQISRFEITIDQWNLCFAHGGCPHKAKQRRYEKGNHPVTRISWHDAFLFTRWLSKITGERYRLPTEEEWAYVAFAGQDVTRETIDQLIENRQMLKTGTFSGFRPTRPVGSFGANAWAISDVTGPVWEWTLTCWFSSDEENRRPWTVSQLNDPELCSNRIVQGDERAHVPFFVDKVYVGGCGTGSPVDHIGFRVVKEPGILERLFASAV